MNPKNYRPAGNRAADENAPSEGLSAATLPPGTYEYALHLLEEVLGAESLNPATVWDLQKALAEGQAISWGTFKFVPPYGSVKIKIRGER
jgi:hypothetical protein